MDKCGILLCARYAISPNLFGYCGPQKSKSLIDHLKDNVADSEMIHILSKFETLYPYLQLIARENKIKDPFDKKVVEAYWIGNTLLKHLSGPYMLSFLHEKLFMNKKTTKKNFAHIAKKLIAKPIFPHHSFHVFNIFYGMKNNIGIPVLNVMDECRIGWGRIIKTQSSKLKDQNLFMIKARPLLMKDKQLVLGSLTQREVGVDYKGKQIIHNMKVGDWVSYHWGYICDFLTENQVRHLSFYTQKAIDFFNH